MGLEFDPDLLDLLESSPSTAFEGSVWRVVFESQPVLRANIRGGRWNPRDSSALYTSLSPDCARAEFEHILTLQPVRPTASASLHTLEVKLGNVLDLTAAARLGLLGIDLDTLDDSLEGQAPFQRIGGGVAFLGFEGLLVPSLRHAGGVNLVIYEANVQFSGEALVKSIEVRPF